MLPNPPSTAIPQFYYGSLASIPSAASGAFFPQSVNGFDKAGQIPTTYNWNFTIQRELPYAILFDVGYVGSSSSHILYRYNQNSIAPGAAWLPQNQDPLNTNPKFDGTTSNQPNFYRPYQGYANAIAYGFGGNANYHSLQVSANRRFSNNLTFGLAYTWSKAMGTTNDDYTTNVPFNTHAADYDVLSTDRTHVFVVNWVYSLPKFVKSNSAGGKIGGIFVNDWQISGIGTMQSGAARQRYFLHRRHRQPERALHWFSGHQPARRVQVQDGLPGDAVCVAGRQCARATSGERQLWLRFVSFADSIPRHAQL